MSISEGLGRSFECLRRQHRSMALSATKQYWSTLPRISGGRREGNIKKSSGWLSYSSCLSQQKSIGLMVSSLRFLARRRPILEPSPSYIASKSRSHCFYLECPLMSRRTSVRKPWWSRKRLKGHSHDLNETFMAVRWSMVEPLPFVFTRQNFKRLRLFMNLDVNAAARKWQQFSFKSIVTIV